LSEQPSGGPIPASLRHRLEKCFGADLTAVRVHTGPDADRLARALGADAVTCGTAMHFRDGCYQPLTSTGQWLIAHESAHVVQQAAGSALGSIALPGLTMSAPGDDCEREADLAADLALAGGTWRGRHPAERRAAAGQPYLIQRHASFEHRLLGDTLSADLEEIAAQGVYRNDILDNLIELLALWKENPGQVQESDIRRLASGIKTVRLGPGNTLVTYGELNALPDFLADAVAIDTVEPAIIVPILQEIRQQTYNQLKKLRTGTDPLESFTGSVCRPIPDWTLVKDLYELTRSTR
jgi:hypothetical protein